MSSKSKFSFSYILMALVAGFAAWVYLHEFKGGIERDKQKSEAAALLPFSNDKIVSVRLFALTPGAHPNEPRIETFLKKDGDTWKIEKPYSDLGDTAAVDSFLSTVSTEKLGETVVEANDIVWKTYGLDAPSAEGEIVAKVDGVERRRSIKIGSVPAFDGSVYARIDGANRVVLMSSTALAALQKDARDFRDKRFFPVAVHPEFSELEVVRSGAPKIHFVLTNGDWHEAAAKIGDWPLDQAAVKSYVQAIAGLRGNDVWAENKNDSKVVKQRKLDHPGISIRLKSEKNETYNVTIASLEKTEQVAAGIGSARPLVFSVYKATIDQLSKTIDSLRDLKFPFQFKISDVHVAELERPSGEVSLPKLLQQNGKWQIDPSDSNFQKRELKPGAAEKLLASMDTISAKRILPAGTTKPKATMKGAIHVSLLQKKGQKVIELVFEPVGDAVRAFSSKVPDRVFELEKSAFDALGFDLVDSPPPAPKGTP